MSVMPFLRIVSLFDLESFLRPDPRVSRVRRLAILLRCMSPPIGDSLMTALLKYLAVLGFAGALSLATTTSFAQNVSGSACGETLNGVYYC